MLRGRELYLFSEKNEAQPNGEGVASAAQRKNFQKKTESYKTKKNLIVFFFLLSFLLVLRFILCLIVVVYRQIIFPAWYMDTLIIVH